MKSKLWWKLIGGLLLGVGGGGASFYRKNYLKPHKGWFYFFVHSGCVSHEDPKRHKQTKETHSTDVW